MPERIAPPADTLLDLLQQQAERHRDRVAFRFCPDGGDEHSRLTYHELDRRARAIAADLQRRGAAGQRVLLFCHPGLDSVAGFFGCFYAGAVAVPVDEQWTSARVATVVPDARAGYALATAKTIEKMRTTVDDLVSKPLTWCCLDEPGADPEQWMLPPVEKNTPAVIQYTSGTTGAPKGVVLTHGNYRHNLDGIYDTWGGTWDLARGTDEPGEPGEPIVGVSWLPHFHDLGFVGGVLMALYLGGTGVLMSPGSVLMRPVRWLEAMSRHRAVVTGAPDFAYEWCVERTTAEQRAALDLSRWSIAISGGGPVSAATLRNFAEAYAPAGFRPEAFLPAYGLAEATLAVSGGSASPLPVVVHVDRTALGEDRVADAAPDDPGTAALVGCGRPGGGQRVIIVDPETRRECGADEVGEIWVAGPSVGRGYWRRRDDTERTFAAYLADTGEGPFLRTGDRGFLRSGELFITGRSQDLITIGGLKYYPNDIEATVQGCHPALLPSRGAVFSVKPRWNATERLIVVQEVHRHWAGEADFENVLEEVLATVRTAITEHHKVEAHAVVLVKPMRIPTTSSGKVQREACRQRFLDGELEPVAQWQGTAPADDVPLNPKQQVAVGLARLFGPALARGFQQGRPPGTGD